MKTTSFAVLLGLFGASAVMLSFALQWPTWVLFIAWVSYYLFGKSLQTSVKPFYTMLLGIAMGSLIQLCGSWLATYIGDLGLPLAVFCLVGSLAFLSQVEALNLIPAWFLGLIIFFGVHPPLAFMPIAGLVLPILGGFLFAYFNDVAIQRIAYRKTSKI